jgi:dolichol-phosphate mannosyltransferase
VIPTYNECENIGLLLRHIHVVLMETGRPFEVIVVDDDSPDGTWAVVQDLVSEYPSLRVIRRINERGLAQAVVRGWQEARGEILAVIDGDLQHPPETLKMLLEALEKEGVDIAVASRHIRGGGVSRWNIMRRGISWAATLAATWLLPGLLATVRDPMSGYFAMRRSVIENCRLNPEGYKILLEVLGRGHYKTVTEVPYTFIEREWGKSKFGLRQCREFVAHLTRLSWETGELKRLVKYCTVGCLGVVVNMGVLTTLTAVGVGYLTAGIVAVETAIGTNFLLNEFWSFADFSRQRQGVRPRLKRFLTFHLFCIGGAGIYLALLYLLTASLGCYYLLSSLLGIAAATIWNYGMNANVTWESARAEQRGR